MEPTDTPFQDLETQVAPGEYVDLDPDDPELLKLRRAAGDPTVPDEEDDA